MKLFTYNLEVSNEKARTGVAEQPKGIHGEMAV
jgi:hypothetical protein